MVRSDFNYDIVWGFLFAAIDDSGTPKIEVCKNFWLLSGIYNFFSFRYKYSHDHWFIPGYRDSASFFQLWGIESFDFYHVTLYSP